MFIFNKENIKKAKEILSKYPEGRQKSAVLPLLDLAQRQNGGWLSVEAIEYVADYIAEPYMRVYEVASFYSMFYLKPVGKYHIQICGTTPCWLKGAEDILQTCEKRIGIKCGNTSADGRFTISEIECLGACVNAPLVQINDDYYEDLTPDKMSDIIDKLSDSKNEQKKLSVRQDEALNLQSVRIRLMQSLTNSIEVTIALQEVTNVVKPIEATYQAATQVKVLSPEIFNIIEVDVLLSTENSMKDGVMVSHHSLYRGLSPWHAMRWTLSELGRSSVFLNWYTSTSQQRQGVVNDIEEVGLTDSTRSIGKLCTWGSGQQWKTWLSTSHNNTPRL